MTAGSSAAGDRVSTVDALPDSLSALRVARPLADAGITPDESEHLSYIVDQVFLAGTERSERLRRFAVLIVLSTMIAAFGLLSDSVAVVIGAMLVAPLMTPILGMAVSLVLTEPERLAASARTVAGGAAGAIVVGWFISLIASGGITVTNLPDEVVGRTAPGLLDLGIAVSAGLAGGYLMIDRKAAASAAGVAIAVALVPPLAVVGICIEMGAWSLALGALLLFTTNLAAIVFSASAVVVVAGVVPRGFLRVRFKQLRLGFAAVLVAVAAVAVPLAAHTFDVIQRDRFESLVADAVAEWDARSVIIDLRSDTDGVWEVDLQVWTPENRSPAWQLAQRITDASGRPIDLDLRFVVEERGSASTR